MRIVSEKEPSVSQTWDRRFGVPQGYAIWPDDLSVDLYEQYCGCVILHVENGIVSGYEPDTARWETMQSAIAEKTTPDVPTTQEDIDAMIIDHEYRLTLMELGMTKG